MDNSFFFFDAGVVSGRDLAGAALVFPDGPVAVVGYTGGREGTEGPGEAVAMVSTYRATEMREELAAEVVEFLGLSGDLEELAYRGDLDDELTRPLVAGVFRQGSHLWDPLTICGLDVSGKSTWVRQLAEAGVPTSYYEVEAVPSSLKRGVVYDRGPFCTLAYAVARGDMGLRQAVAEVEGMPKHAVAVVVPTPGDRQRCIAEARGSGRHLGRVDLDEQFQTVVAGAYVALAREAKRLGWRVAVVDHLSRWGMRPGDAFARVAQLAGREVGE